jgi:glycosyltransferase involved in cell wall biosynthesis
VNQDIALTILLPAHNEEKALGRLLDEIEEQITLPHEVLVINNASSDRTQRIALNKGATVLPVPERGKGNAIRSSIRVISTPYIIMMNSDWTYPPKHIPAIHRRLILGADIVMGCRTLVDKGAMTLLHSTGNWFLSLLASLLYGYPVRDLCTGLWGFRTNVLRSLPLTSTHFTLEADMFVGAIQGKYKLEQFPISYRARLDGDKPKLRFTDGLLIAKHLISRRVK